MEQLVKERKAVINGRGIFIEGMILNQTAFKIGTGFRFEIDKDSKTVTLIVDPASARNTVSKRKRKESLQPVIDIRNKDIVSMWADCTSTIIRYYQTTIEIQGVQ